MASLDWPGLAVGDPALLLLLQIWGQGRAERQQGGDRWAALLGWWCRAGAAAALAADAADCLAALLHLVQALLHRCFAGAALAGVRIVHLPTGLAVKCTQERTQLANRAIAMQMLRRCAPLPGPPAPCSAGSRPCARLHPPRSPLRCKPAFLPRLTCPPARPPRARRSKLLVVLEEQQAQQVAEIRGDMVVAAWGRQVRNYVLQPYKLVKDTRTGVETSDVQGVMDGGLDPFMTAYLRQKGAVATQEMLGELEARAL